MAGETPLDGNVTTATKHYIICGTLFTIAVAVYIMRMYTRLRNLGWDDYTITLAVVICTVELALQIAAYSQGLGRYQYYVSAEDQVDIFRYIFAMCLVGIWTAPLVRISISCMLLRLKTSPAWQWVLKTIIGIQIASAGASNICQVVQCRPVRAMWDVVPGAKCWSPAQIQAYGYVYNSVNIMSDILLSLMPISFIRKLRRPLFERLLLAFLMALGLIAGSIAIMRLISLRKFDLTSGGSLRSLSETVLLTRVEELVGIIAACAPLLKPSLVSILHSLGIITKDATVWHLNSFVYRSNRRRQLDSISTEVGNSRRNSSDGT
ncbi:hypothetical protein BKA66DRAFT_479925 [Pyrenochaeta sp. MPI-SDFR-AT-0127]|nr:hypothetical protein BKA66DRAFT_479925 [Pyrenochaeta sp. MPI-SDFR-AT-0127]